MAEDISIKEALIRNGNETEEIWMKEFQRIAGPNAALSDDAQVALHVLRQERQSTHRQVNA